MSAPGGVAELWLIAGASSGIGRALAEEGASRGKDLIIISSDRRDLEALASDLSIRFAVRVTAVVADARDASRFATEVAQVCSALPAPSAAFFPLGASIDDDTPGSAVATIGSLFSVNLFSIAAVIRDIAPRMAAAGGGTIVGFSSIAAVRGRRRNVYYAAAKRALESLFESLRHEYDASGVTVQLYRLGYVDTSLAYGKKLLLPVASPRAIALFAIRRLGATGGIMALPRYWKLVGLAVRSLPWRVYRKLNF